MKNTLLFLLLIGIFLSCHSSIGGQKNINHKYTNHLIDQSSPYLLQHAHNPVDWHPWGDEALNKAKAENKMLLISVGYSACHWCHVMEHESFEDTTVAKIMNDNFVCIKVDREERPDIDDVYMTACHAATGKSCGWPLNAFALPDGRPVWAGTYFPKKEWIDVLNYFLKEREKNSNKMEEYAANLTKGIQDSEKIQINTTAANFTETKLKNIGNKFLKQIDFKRGGRKGAPKFPMPNNYEFLLRYYDVTKDAQALEAVTKTLDEMAAGGIYDQLGGGFARYSVDGEWHVPHFEKMLYDNGQLVGLYAMAYRLTKNPRYQEVLKETLAFISRELTDPNGGFYSSLDADSEGEEGKFYVWNSEEIDSLLTNENDRTIFKEYYDVKKRGNWEEHKNVLRYRQSIASLADKTKTTKSEVHAALNRSKKILFSHRATRIRPGLDDKILTGWNALMLSGYVEAYRALGEEVYLKTALKNANFIKSTMLQKDFRLNRNYKSKKSVINAFLDDYALTIKAFTDLYQVTFDEEWLQLASGMADYVVTHFYDSTTGMFYYTSDLDPPLVVRKMELADNVIPGSNSAMARSLFTLGTFLYQPKYIELSQQMMNNMSTTIIPSEQPSFYSNWCNLYLQMAHTPYEVAVIGDNFATKQKALMGQFLPNAFFLGGKTEGSLALLEGKLQEDRTMIYVCQNKVCKLPVEDVEKAVTLIK